MAPRPSRCARRRKLRRLLLAHLLREGHEGDEIEEGESEGEEEGGGEDRQIVRLLLGGRMLDALTTPLWRWNRSVVHAVVTDAPASPVQFVDVAEKAGVTLGGGPPGRPGAITIMMVFSTSLSPVT